MRIVLLTRTSRPSGALMAQALVKNKLGLVAIIAEERQELLKKKGGRFSILAASLRQQGFNFTRDKVLELLNIKLHFCLRQILSARIYQSKKYLSIEELALTHRNIPYSTVKDHNSQETEQLLASFSPDLVVLTNTRIIRKNILTIPKAGTLNLHLSKLPHYAGLNSIFWALYYGEKEIGISVHFVNEKLDAGDIILQRTIPVEKGDTEKRLYAKALSLGVSLMLNAIMLIQQNMVEPVQQEPRLISCFKWPTAYQRQLLRKKLRRRSRINRERPLKVLHIITRLVKGGAQENTVLTVRGLKEKGYEVILASGKSYGPEGEIESSARNVGINVVIIPELVRSVHPWKDLVSFIKILAFIKKHRFDIVHTHSSKAGILGRWAARLAGTPVVVHTPHGHIFHSYFGSVQTRWFHILEMISAHFCDRIITLTDRCKQEHIKLKVAQPEKFTTIHSGIELDKFLNCSFDTARIRQNLNIPADRRIVGTVSRLEPIKGMQFFLDAAEHVLGNFPDTHFLIVGDGSLKKGLEEKVRLSGISDRFTFTGLRNDIPSLISIMDLFVLASLNEGMGRVLVEAGLLAKPVVATRVSGIPELVEHGLTGILVEPADPQALAQGIVEILSHPQRAKAMGETAKKKMAEDFSSQRMLEKIESLYKELL